MAGPEAKPATNAEVPGDVLRTAVRDLNEAAWREGIDRTAPLGVFVHALGQAITIMADTAERQERGVSTVIENARSFAEAEVASLRVANDMSRNILAQARSTLAGAEIERETVIAEFVKTATPQLTKALGAAVVIREKQHNADVRWRRAFSVAGVTLGLFVCGQIWANRHSAADISDGALAVARIRQCVAKPFVDAKKEAYCLLRDLLPPG